MSQQPTGDETDGWKALGSLERETPMRFYISAEFTMSLETDSEGVTVVTIVAPVSKIEQLLSKDQPDTTQPTVIEIYRDGSRPVFDQHTPRR